MLEGSDEYPRKSPVNLCGDCESLYPTYKYVHLQKRIIWPETFISSSVVTN